MVKIQNKVLNFLSYTNIKILVNPLFEFLTNIMSHFSGAGNVILDVLVLLYYQANRISLHFAFTKSSRRLGHAVEPFTLQVSIADAFISPSSCHLQVFLEFRACNGMPSFLSLCITLYFHPRILSTILLFIFDMHILVFQSTITCT